MLKSQLKVDHRYQHKSPQNCQHKEILKQGDRHKGKVMMQTALPRLVGVIIVQVDNIAL